MENEINTIEIRSLKEKDSFLLYNLFQKNDPTYYLYFTPFEINLQAITHCLVNAKKDQYLGFFIHEQLIGFFMIRGLDAGYEIPAYGVFISERYKGKGLARLSVEYSIGFCKLNQIQKLMLKVHPSNIQALNLYVRMGFVQTGFDIKNSNLVFHKAIREYGF